MFTCLAPVQTVGFLALHTFPGALIAPVANRYATNARHIGNELDMLYDSRGCEVKTPIPRRSTSTRHEWRKSKRITFGKWGQLVRFPSALKLQKFRPTFVEGCFFDPVGWDQFGLAGVAVVHSTSSLVSALAVGRLSPSLTPPRLSKMAPATKGENIRHLRSRPRPSRHRARTTWDDRRRGRRRAGAAVTEGSLRSGRGETSAADRSGGCVRGQRYDVGARSRADVPAPVGRCAG